MNRRNLLVRIVQGFTLAGAGFVAYPFLRSFVPTFVQDLNLDIDLSDLKEGQGKVVHWLGRNITIERRTQTALDTLETFSGELKDPDSEKSNQPAFAENQYRSLEPEYFVAYNNCTHLGCEVVSGGKGYKCPCHQSDYDAAGRVFEDAAAPTNLEIPHYRFVKSGVIRLEQQDS